MGPARSASAQLGARKQVSNWRAGERENERMRQLERRADEQEGAKSSEQKAVSNGCQWVSIALDFSAEFLP